MNEPHTFPLLLRAHPFSADPGVIHAAAGQTLEQMLREAAGGRELAELEVRCGGYAVPRDLWDRVRPKEGAVIEVTGVPQGSRANWQIVLMIVVAYFTIGGGSIAGWSLGTSTAAGTAWVQLGAYIVGSADCPALVAPPITSIHYQETA